VSSSDTEMHQEAVPFTFVGIKHEVQVSLMFLNSLQFYSCFYVYLYGYLFRMSFWYT